MSNMILYYMLQITDLMFFFFIKMLKDPATAPGVMAQWQKVLNALA